MSDGAVAIGQIWQVVGGNSGRKVEVVGIQGNWIRIRTIISNGKPRTTWAMAGRFHGMHGGYVRLERSPTTDQS
jgi:hypothetical protein